jgi:hypothetical protein
MSNRRPLIAALNISPPYSDIAAHESGHYFAGLVDEYTNAVSGYTPAEAPNSTAKTNVAQIRWSAWIDPSTPLPTPNSYAHDGLIGLFEGAQYQTKGWYRPKFRCKMGAPDGTEGLGIPFCEVCSEHIVKTIYLHVCPFDACSPASSNVMAYSTQAVAFSISPLRPWTHDLQAQWSTNGVMIPSATNAVFLFQPGQSGNGSHAVGVIVQDPTTLVRTDPAHLLSRTNTWTVSVSLNELQLTSPLMLGGGRFRFTVTGAAPQGFVIQASTNCSNWVRLSTNSLSGGKLDYTNSGNTGVPFRYFRTVSPP